MAAEMAESIFLYLAMCPLPLALSILSNPHCLFPAFPLPRKKFVLNRIRSCVPINIAFVAGRMHHFAPHQIRIAPVAAQADE